MTTRRRTLLALAGATLAGLAGCAGQSDSDPSSGTPDGTPTGTPEKTPTETPDDTPTVTPDEADGESDSTAGGLSAEVDLSTASYVAAATTVDETGYQRQENTPRAISEFPEPFADTVREARGGGFETDDPSEELLAAVDDITKPRSNQRWLEPAVRIDGTAYVVELQLPVLEVRLGEEILEEADPDRTVSVEDKFAHEAVESLVKTIAWNGTPNTARGSYRRSLVPDAVEAFLDSYDYVEDERGISPIVVERHNWEPPYTIELRPFTAEDRWGREILDAQALDDDLQTFLEALVESGTGLRSPPYVTDDVPASYFETVETDTGDAGRPLVRIGGTVYRVNVSEGDHGSVPVTLAAESAEPTDDGLARFRVTVEITDDKPGAEVAPGEPVELHSVIGLPSALWIAHGDEYHLLNSDRYEVAVASEDGGESWLLDVEDPELEEITVSEELWAGDELTATYTVPGTVPEGSYTLAGNFAALWKAAPEGRNEADGIYPYEVGVTLSY